MKKYKINKDCVCEATLYEMKNYPRKGLTEKKLRKNDVVEFVQILNVFNIDYHRVRKGKVNYDIHPDNLDEIK